MSPRAKLYLIVISQMLAALIQTVVFDAAIKFRALAGNFGLSIIAHRATWVSSNKFTI